jgi:hypothetical protein
MPIFFRTYFEDKIMETSAITVMAKGEIAYPRC